MSDVITSENEEDLQTQIEEVEALSSIYADEWCVIDEASRIFCIKISNDTDQKKLTACLQIILPPDYPSTAPPIYQINAAWLRGPERMELANSLEDLYVEHAGESILYLWVERIREFLVEKSQSSDTVSEPETVNMTAEVEDDEDVPDFRTLKLNTEDAHLSLQQADDEELPHIKHGNTITDRRSTFQPHLAPVVTPRQVNAEFLRLTTKPLQSKFMSQLDHFSDKLIQIFKSKGGVKGQKIKSVLANTDLCDNINTRRECILRSLILYLNEDPDSFFKEHLVKKVLEKLYENKKIASATHNIYAYRIYCEDKNSFLQDCEDDGETAAGGRLLHLLQILDVRNVLVVVSRWYGGILLGPDRFKHINNCGRKILVENGFIACTEEANKPDSKSKKAKSKKTK